MSLRADISRDQSARLSLLRRAGVNCSVMDLTAAICKAFVTFNNVSEEDVVRRFRGCGAGGHLIDAIAIAKTRLAAEDNEILLVGCGEGIAGRRAELISAIIGDPEVMPNGAVTIRNLTMEDFSKNLYSLQILPKSNLVVTHSFVHYLYDPGMFLETVAQAVLPGGLLVMAHEPNRRFYASLGDRQPVRRPRLPEAVQRLKRTLFGKPAPMAISMNEQLRKQCGLRHDLTAHELLAIVDPYMPNDPAQHPLGGPGFDWEELGREYLPGFDLVRVKTYGSLAGDPHRDDPLMGRSFTAVWKSRVQ